MWCCIWTIICCYPPLTSGYNTCPCLLPIQVSRLPFPSSPPAPFYLSHGSHLHRFSPPEDFLLWPNHQRPDFHLLQFFILSYFILAAEWIMSPMMEAAVMADHFDSINKLPEGVAGVPNWRCVPGYQVPQGNDKADGGWWMCPKGRMHTTEWHLESHVQPTLESSPGLAIGSFHSISA